MMSGLSVYVYIGAIVSQVLGDIIYIDVSLGHVSLGHVSSGDVSLGHVSSGDVCIMIWERS